MIRLQVIGNLGRDAEYKTLDSGRKVINFSVAHTEKYKSGDEMKEKTTWIDCAWWTDNGERIMPYLKKGTQVYVEGNPDARGWVSKEGVAGATLSISVRDLRLLGQAVKKEDVKEEEPKSSSSSKTTTSKSAQRPTVTMDDLPF
jgi:single-strand DNA-binding protein